MRWVINFHYLRGLHFHQYALPTAGPTSHGCVRLLNPDAKWLYRWIDTWNRTEDGRLLDRAPLIIIGDVSGYKPSLFRNTPSGPELRRVDLPDERTARYSSAATRGRKWRTQPVSELILGNGPGITAVFRGTNCSLVGCPARSCRPSSWGPSESTPADPEPCRIIGARPVPAWPGTDHRPS